MAAKWDSETNQIAGFISIAIILAITVMCLLAPFDYLGHSYAADRVLRDKAAAEAKQPELTG